MNNGIYAASTGLLARTQELDLAANNLANANTSGFRGQRVSFKTPDDDRLVQRFHPRRQLLRSPRLAAYRFLPGLSAADRQPARPRPGRLRLLRRPGSHRHPVHPQRQLPSHPGWRPGHRRRAIPVLGDKGPITLPEGNAEISSAGVISVNGDVAGQLQLTAIRFQRSAHSARRRLLLRACRPPPPPPASSPCARDRSRAPTSIPSSAAVGLIEIQRNAEMMQRALTTFHNEFNKTRSRRSAQRFRSWPCFVRSTPPPAA